jgi:hypothetical protein
MPQVSTIIPTPDLNDFMRWPGVTRGAGESLQVPPSFSKSWEEGALALSHHTLHTAVCLQHICSSMVPWSPYKQYQYWGNGCMCISKLITSCDEQVLPSATMHSADLGDQRFILTRKVHPARRHLAVTPGEELPSICQRHCVPFGCTDSHELAILQQITARINGDWVRR